jgi:predicted nucleic acid-binding protein
LIYYDTAYLAKCYLREPGHGIVRAHARKAGVIACCDLGRAELMAVFHRNLREENLSRLEFEIVCRQYQADLAAGVWRWLPVNAELWESVDRHYQELAPSIFLRAADAIHLACAKKHGFQEIFTNDPHLLAASKAFGVTGLNLLS